jgi:predicted MFS family arabinose efflux permease
MAVNDQQRENGHGGGEPSRSPSAVILSSPLSGWILGHWDWRILLIAEGTLPILCLIIWAVMIHDVPREEHAVAPPFS